MTHRFRGIFWLLGLAALLLLVGCVSQASTPQPAATPTEPVASAQPVLPLVLASPTPVPLTQTPTVMAEPGLRLWYSPGVPGQLKNQLNLPQDVIVVDFPEESDLRFEIGLDQPVARWVYALVAPFPTIPDGINADLLQQAWRVQLKEGPFAGLPLLMDSSTAQVFSEVWGAPAQGALRILDNKTLLDAAWENQPAWGIVPFEALDPRWKVLTVDGLSPLHKDFDPQQYALTVTFSLFGDRSQELLPEAILTNRDPQKMTTVMLTGVTALVRATAETMRRNGLTYPAQDIGIWLREADLLHINNEVPFDPDCPQPDPWQEDLVFCSRPEYITLLEEIETDLVELSGDHFADFGPDAMRYTLDLYQEKGMPYYGGGYTEEDARKPYLFEHNGNKIAFLGCNAKGGGYATARGDYPGAVECDNDWLTEEIRRLSAEGYLPIVTLQHFEYYTYVPQPSLIESFHTLAEAGPVIVSGSQAHQPHGMEFVSNTFLHYGLGNLFFDQYHFGLPTSHALIDRHVFYDGRYISTELLGIRFVDFARSRPVTPEEREELLRRVFDASLWNPK
jgi:hypothetical protein